MSRLLLLLVAVLAVLCLALTVLFGAPGRSHAPLLPIAPEVHAVATGPASLSDATPLEPQSAPNLGPGRESAQAKGLVLFDGATFQGWRRVDPWVIVNGEITHPRVRDLTPALGTERVITGPFELTVEVMLVGRHMEDGRSILLVQGEHGIQLRLDNQPDEFEVLVHPGLHPVKRSHVFARDAWNVVVCRVEADGKVTAILNGGEAIRTSWKGGYPVSVELECQRSGARFKSLVVRYL